MLQEQLSVNKYSDRSRALLVFLLLFWHREEKQGR